MPQHPLTSPSTCSPDDVPLTGPVGVNLHIFDDSDAAAGAVDDRIVSLVQRKPDAVLGLATGDTQLPVYRHLVEANRRGRVSFSRVRTFNLDEYVGLSVDDPSSFASYMRRAFFDHVDIRDDQIHLLNGDALDLIQEAQAFEAAIAMAGGIDLQILGIGRNGHIAFNEPGSGRSSRVRVVALSENTLAANAVQFASRCTPPRTAITMGIANILSAREIALLGLGSGKNEALRQALRGSVHSGCPASFLREHPNTCYFLDAAAGAGVCDGSL